MEVQDNIFDFAEYVIYLHLIRNFQTRYITEDMVTRCKNIIDEGFRKINYNKLDLTPPIVNISTDIDDEYAEETFDILYENERNIINPFDFSIEEITIPILEAHREGNYRKVLAILFGMKEEFVTDKIVLEGMSIVDKNIHDLPTLFNKVVSKFMVTTFLDPNPYIGNLLKKAKNKIKI